MHTEGRLNSFVDLVIRCNHVQVFFHVYLLRQADNDADDMEPDVGVDEPVRCATGRKSRVFVVLILVHHHAQPDDGFHDGEKEVPAAAAAAGGMMKLLIASHTSDRSAGALILRFDKNDRQLA